MDREINLNEPLSTSVPIYEDNNKANIIKFFVANGLLNNSAKCFKCGTSMTLKKRSCVDCFAWRCSNMDCRTYRSVRYGSFFETNRIPLDKIVKLLFHFTTDVQVCQSEKLLGLARSTISDFQQRLRYVCGKYIERHKILLGGPGKIVEIDESMFSKIKHHRGKDMKKMSKKEQLWVFGMKERESGKVKINF